MNKCPISHFTPTETVDIIIKDIHFKEDDICLEPCKGDGRIYNRIPTKKDWCEIDEGRDIFTYMFDVSFTKIITNPPYKTNHIEAKDRKNITVKVIERCFELCTDECWFLLNNQMLNSLTPIRLKKYELIGWILVFIRILNIPCWYGRYYFVCFKKGGKSIVSY
jgi:hypothetical protein